MGVFEIKSGMTQFALAAADLLCAAAGGWAVVAFLAALSPGVDASGVSLAVFGGMCAGFVAGGTLLLVSGHYRRRLAEGLPGRHPPLYHAATVVLPLIGQVCVLAWSARTGAVVTVACAALGWSIAYWWILSPVVGKALLGWFRCWGARDRVLVVLGGGDAEHFRRHAIAPFAAFFEPVGWGWSSGSGGGKDRAGTTALPSLRNPQLGELLVSHHISRVLVEDTVQADQGDLVSTCADLGIQIWSVGFAEGDRCTFSILGGNVDVERQAVRRFLAQRVKDGVDVLLALSLLSVSLPVMAVIAFAVRISSSGPALFHQERAGWYGRTFTMLKFRSMRQGAENPSEEIVADEPGDILFKPRDDPRVTPLGRFLRRSSLDELPQFLNVLRGEMSVVGPRPMPLYETARFRELGQHRRAAVKPGLTGLWQVSGRSNIRTMGERISLDLEYVDNWSLRLDLRLLLKTVPAVLTAKGAQ